LARTSTKVASTILLARKIVMHRMQHAGIVEISKNKGSSDFFQIPELFNNAMLCT